MITNFNEALNNFCRYYNGPKICINSANLGFSFNLLQVVPGGSRVLHSLLIHYSDEALIYELKNNFSIDEKNSKEVAHLLSIKSTLRYGGEYVHIGITGSTSKSKWDRKDAKAFVSIDEKLYKIKFDELELEEFIILEKREMPVPILEDQILCQAILSILTHGLENMPELKNGFIKNIDL